STEKKIMSSSSVFLYDGIYDETCDEPYDEPYNEPLNESYNEPLNKFYDDPLDEHCDELHNDNTTQELTNMTCLDEVGDDESLPSTETTITHK
ncbi:15071_t:CDS:1, partial [Racocetra fulgida]